MRREKGKSTRQLPSEYLWPPEAVPGLATVMRWWLRLRTALGGSDYMWQLPWETTKPTTASIAAMLARTLSRAGRAAPAGRSWTAHSLRKGAASESNALGVPLSRSKSMGGWSQKGRTMEDTYIDEKCVDNPSGQRFFGWLRPRSAAELARVPVGPASVSVEDRPTPPASAPAPVMRL